MISKKKAQEILRKMAEGGWFEDDPKKKPPIIKSPNSKPTPQDSARLYYNTLELEKFYNDPARKYKKRTRSYYPNALGMGIDELIKENNKTQEEGQEKEKEKISVGSHPFVACGTRASPVLPHRGFQQPHPP